MNFELLISQALHLPTMLALVVGVFLIATRRLPRSTRALGLSGCALLLLALLIGVAWNLAIPTLLSTGSLARFQIAAVGMGLLQTILHTVGLALLIGAVLTGRVPAAAAPETTPRMPVAPRV